MVNLKIAQLVNYGLSCGLFEEDDKVFMTNQIAEALGLTEHTEPENVPDAELEDILKGLLDYAAETGIIEDSIVYRDLFDTKMMNCLMPRPGQVQATFNSKYEESPEAATDYFYKLSQDSDYIRRYRVKKDMKWKRNTIKSEK